MIYFQDSEKYRTTKRKTIMDFSTDDVRYYDAVRNIREEIAQVGNFEIINIECIKDFSDSIKAGNLKKERSDVEIKAAKAERLTPSIDI